MRIVSGNRWKCEREKERKCEERKGQESRQYWHNSCDNSSHIPPTFAHLDKPRASLYVRLYLCLYSYLEAVELAGSARLQELLQAGNVSGGADFQRLLCPRGSQGRSGLEGAGAAAALCQRAPAGQGTAPTALRALCAATAGHIWTAYGHLWENRGVCGAALLCTHPGRLRHRALGTKKGNQRRTAGKD